MADASRSSGSKRSSGSRGSRGSGSGDEIPTPTDEQGRLSVLVEFRLPTGGSASFAMSEASRIDLAGFELDPKFDAVPMGSGAMAAGMADASETVVLRGTVTGDDEMAALRARPDVAEVWLDTPIAPFQMSDDDEAPQLDLADQDASMAACPIPPCDCASGTPKGTIADVATYLGVPNIWTAGFKGAGIVVGVVDGGITAQGRPVKSGEGPRRIGRVIGGWPVADWGTEADASGWNQHGNMCATDVLGMAPEAQIFDLRIGAPGNVPSLISRAVQAFQWAIDRHRIDGTPQVLSNSWGIYQESWDATYARNPNHPFTRKVVEAINEGIIVLFAAGNCGNTCPSANCGTDNGPGKSIWGANGHPLVMTVGAVNHNEQFIGYSSQGPAALDANKPDFCGISHFTGYTSSDNGTSAAAPILAGVAALLKQAAPSATQASIKNCLRSTAKNIGPAGFDQNSGAGIVQAHAAFNCIRPPLLPITRPPQCLVLETRQAQCFVPVTRPPQCLVLQTRQPQCFVPVTRPPQCLVLQTRPPQCATPVVTVACPRVTVACPRVTIACGIPIPIRRPVGFAQDDPYASAGEYWTEDPYADAYADPYGEAFDSGEMRQPPFTSFPSGCGPLPPTAACPRPTAGPPCFPTVNPPCPPRPTMFPGCPPPGGQTVVPRCPPTAIGCPPPTSPPACPRTSPPLCPPTSAPFCPPTSAPLQCPQTLPPRCLPTAPPRCPPTLSPQCPRTSPPRCLPTGRPRCPVTSLPQTCPRTIGPPCPRPTLPPGCGPRPTMTCMTPDAGLEYADPYAGMTDEYGYGEDPYQAAYGYDPSAAAGGCGCHGDDPSAAMYGYVEPDETAGEYWYGYEDPTG